MLDLLKFDISASNARAVGALRDVRGELGGIRGALVGVSDYARRAGRSMRNIGAGMSAAVTAPLMLLGQESVRLFDIQQRAEDAVATVITSTNGAAGRSLGDLKALASEMQGMTTFGDEDILQNVTAPLLTFTKIQGDVFDRAQTSVLDMATLLKMDLKSASVLVGKALNDPIKGMSALSRSGVQFTDAQKDVVKALVETGDTAAAQALILEELETQFGGQAAAAAAAPLGQMRQLQNAIGDVKEELGREIVPFLVPLVENVKLAVQWFANLSPEVKKNIVVFGGIAAAAGPVLAFFGMAVMGVGALTGAFATMAAALLANPILAIIAAIAAGAFLIYQNWETVSGFFVGLWDRVREGASTGWAAIKGAIEEYSPQWLKDAWSVVVDHYAGLWQAIKGTIALGWGEIKALLAGEYSAEQLVMAPWRGIGDFFAGLSGEAVAGFTAIWSAIQAEVNTWPGKFVAIGGAIVDGLREGIAAKWEGIKDWFGGLATGLIESTKERLGIQSPSRVFKGIGQNITEGLSQGIMAGAGDTMAAMANVSNGLIDQGEKSLDFLGMFKSGVKTILNDVLTGAKSFGESFRGVIANIGNQLLSRGIDGLVNALFPFANGGAFAGGALVPFAAGGIVSGPTTFPMRGGTGLMGEAGPEAIMPLTRIGGKLGVRAAGPASGGAQRVDVYVHPSGEFDVRMRENAGAVYDSREGATVRRAVTSVYSAARERPIP